MINISRIQAWSFRCLTPKPVATSFGVMYDRSAVLLRVEDDDGAFGWGEVFSNWPAAGAEHRVRLLEMDIADLVLGVHAKAPEEIFHRLEAQTRIRATQCGETGPFAQVIAGLDIAIWDLAARKAAVPLRKLLNPNAASVVPAYASGIQVTQATEIIPIARNGGHKHFKVKVGFDTIEAEVEMLDVILSSLGQEETLACDANQAWSFEQSQSFVDSVEGLPLSWLEEPMPVFAPSTDWHTLSNSISIPLAGGENIVGLQAFYESIRTRYLSVIQPDVAKWGGITGCRLVAEAAMNAGLRYCPHFLGAGIGLMASAELLAAVGGGGLLEVDVNSNPLRSLFFVNEDDVVTDGNWRLSESHGIGIDRLPEELMGFNTLQIDRW